MNAIVNASPMAPVSSRFAAVPQENDLAGGITGGYGLVTYKGKVWTLKYQGQEMVLMRPDGDGPRNSIELVILKANPHLSKIWYENGYVEGSNAAPDCSAANGLKPDAGVPKPQHTVCATCPKNQWGSDPRGGKGKACGDSRRLAVVPLQDIPNESLGGPLLLRVPAASLQDMAAFSNSMQSKGYPYYSIGVRVGFDAKESYPKFEFSAIRPLTDVEADIVIGMQKSEAVARVVSEPSPAETAQAQALAAASEKPLFEQPPTTQSTVAQPAAQVQQPTNPPVTPAAEAAAAEAAATPAAAPAGDANAVSTDTTQPANASQKTDFSELTASFKIANGVARNDDLSMKSPFIRLGGAGDIDVGAGQMNYLAKATVVASGEGQGGKDANQLKGLTVPVRLSGPFEALSYKIEFGAMLEDATKAKVEEKKQEIKAKAEEAVKDKAKDLFKGLLGK